MHSECQSCEFHRNCINGLYCLKLKKYVQYSLKKNVKLKQQTYEDKRL